MNTITKYWQARRQKYSHHLAVQVSGIDLGPMIEQAKSAIFWLILCASVLFLLSEQASASNAEHAGTIKEQMEEIKALRKIVASCLGDKDGPIWVGNELYLCKAVSTGYRS